MKLLIMLFLSNLLSFLLSSVQIFSSLNVRDQVRYTLQCDSKSGIMNDALRVTRHSVVSGFLSWNSETSHVDLEKELEALTSQAPEGEEARNGKGFRHSKRELHHVLAQALSRRVQSQSKLCGICVGRSGTGNTLRLPPLSIIIPPILHSLIYHPGPVKWAHLRPKYQKPRPPPPPPPNHRNENETETLAHTSDSAFVDAEHS
jgi:hypothetical protein